jgi:hypothetical protein
MRREVNNWYKRDGRSGETLRTRRMKVAKSTHREVSTLGAVTSPVNDARSVNSDNHTSITPRYWPDDSICRVSNLDGGFTSWALMRWPLVEGVASNSDALLEDLAESLLTKSGLSRSPSGEDTIL